MPDTVNPIEIVWTLLNLFGLSTTFVNWLWARERNIELKRSGENGVLAVLRGGAEADQLKYVGVFVCLTVIGFVTLTLPPNPESQGIAQLNGWMLLLLDLLLIWTSVSGRLRPSSLRTQFRLRSLEERLAKEQQTAQDAVQDAEAKSGHHGELS